ncbi:nitrous oxide reductase family maturation protein NosD [Sulfurimonas autotrophica]|uniref:Nitrous oxidase accessory protein NosD n=1 Tax=Sulfurimonas autotrophica (strain ATCC BAA-671 / DSM 16294 / JCM 11897 / OK10) TaxID=563040 RepID=E0URD4_SULAO|nr:nitrous oxide reductase family maturation protein NosD [Sulfurimonas autotrophica]ADN10020.1 nitrous oxidase accessory protein NosD [Sulfurimonas autotrophica DSM 16294]
MKFFFLVLFSSALVFANALQDAIDVAPPYATLKLQNALYKGNIHIDKPLTIIGIGEHVIIKGDGVKNVISVRSSEVILKHLIIQNSGMNMQSIDAAISMKQVQNCEIRDCNISEVLYGIDMDRVNNSMISHNYITTKKNDLPLRANALKLYYANHNVIEFNIIENVRDVTLNYSHHNLFKKNQFQGNRFATHLSLSHNNRFINNIYKYNSVAMMFMGAQNTQVIGNEILSSNGAAGIGVMIGSVANFIFKNNRVSYNAKALYIQGQEKAKGMKRYIIGNEISYNGEALHFHASIKDNTITNNKIFSNIDDVVKDAGKNFESSNVVEYNYWDRYAGFDENNDGIGDIPYDVYQYADQLWHYNHKVKFFYASPIMSMLNFLSHLAPFIEPNLIMEDKKPTYQFP